MANIIADRNEVVAREQATVIMNFLVRKGGDCAIAYKQPGRNRAIEGLVRAGLIQATSPVGNFRHCRLTEAGWNRVGTARRAKNAGARAARLAIEAANAEAEADRLIMKAHFAQREREQEEAAFMAKLRRDYRA